jgi:CRP/FNR family transcriptional regulator, cyclic AMP receptor protein
MLNWVPPTLEDAMSEFTNFLKQADIFYQFKPAQLEMVASLCQERTYNDGEIVVEEGSSSKELYIITDGKVDVLINPALVGKPDVPRELANIATLRRGQSFGEVALVDEGLRSATVRAASKNTRLLVISRDKLIALCETSPQLGYQLMYNLAADLAMKIRNTDFRMRENLLNDPENSG